jgi:MFS family permease
LKIIATSSDHTSSTPTDSRLKTTLRAFRNRNYRLYFFGQAISITGTWMQSIALNWLVYRLTNSVFMLGVIGFVLYAPNFFFAPIAGVFADRTSRFKMFFTTQVLAMCQALTLAVLVMTDTIQVWHIVVLAGVLGTINSFDFPSRQSMVVLLVEDKKDLSNAIALNSSMVNLARMLGPSFAGILIALIGEGWCFLINGISYIAVLGCLLAMRLRPQEITQGKANVWRGFREGVNYAFGSPAIRLVLILLAFVSIVGMPYAALMPVYARDILHGDSKTLGFLMGATGLGAITAAILLASRRSVVGLERQLAIAAACMGTGLIAISYIKDFWMALPFMYLIGIGMISQIAVSNTILQTLVDEDKRGRVISLYVATFVGMLPFGNLLTGSLASAFGTPETMFITGILLVIASIAFTTQLKKWREHAYPIIAEHEASGSAARH